MLKLLVSVPVGMMELGQRGNDKRGLHDRERL
jgi:hypothetical protein